jgi:hypothetical protein
MPTSPRHGFQKWSSGFTQSDVILNADIDMLDVRLGLSVRSRTENAPLGGDAAGDCYIITGTPSGAFSAFTEHYVAFYDGTTWYEFAPVTGQVAWVEDDANGVTFNGAAWTVTSSSLTLLLDKLDATVAPAVTNDVDEGYGIGSMWLDVTADAAYVCLDATDGAAVWKRVDNVAISILNNFSATSDPGVGDDDGDGYAIGSWWVNITAQRVWLCEDASTGAAVWLPIYGHAKVRVVSGTSDTILITDSGGTVVYTNASAIAVTLPATFTGTFQFTVVQAGTGVPTVTRSSSDTINGAATGVTPAAQWKGMFFTQYAANTWLCLK